MQKKNPFDVIKSKHVTEKAKVLENLKDAKSNPSLKKCDSPKYVFLVDKRANKVEIASAIETIYADKKIKVTKVNTITNKPKAKMVRGRLGFKPGFKKAVVTLRSGDVIDDKV